MDFGIEQEARAAGYDVEDHGPVGRFQAPHGDFYSHLSGQRPRPRPGGWQIPDPAFLAALPRDPEVLLARLSSDSPDNGPTYCGPFTYAGDGKPSVRSSSATASSTRAGMVAKLPVPT